MNRKMDVKREIEIIGKINKRRYIHKTFQNLVADIADKVLGGPLDESRIEKSYNDYISGVISYSDFPKTIQELILEKAKLESNEIIKSYIDEVEKQVEKFNNMYGIFNSILGEIWIYKIENITYE